MVETSVFPSSFARLRLIFCFFLLPSRIVTTWRTARSVTPLGAVGVAAVVAADPSPPLSSIYAKADFTMVSEQRY